MTKVVKSCHFLLVCFTKSDLCSKKSICTEMFYYEYI